MERYNEYKDSGVQWLGEIPSHWEVKHLRNFLTIFSEKGYGDKQLLSVTREKGVILRDKDNKEENHNFVPDDLSGYKHLCAGDFVINKMKSWQGSYGVSEYEGIVSPAYFTCKLRGVDPKFFSRAIRSKAYIGFFMQYSKGIRVDQWDLDPNSMKDIPFVLPTLPEQQAIANYLDTATAKIDEAIAQQQKMIDLLNERKQIIINNAVTKGLNPDASMKDSGVDWIGEIPEHWEVMKTSHIFHHIGSGTTPKSGREDYYSEDGIPFLQTGDLNDGFINETSKHITEKALRDTNLKLYPKGSLVVAMYGATIGKLGILNIDTTVNQACCVLPTSDRVGNKFAMYVLSTAKADLLLKSRGGGQPNISQDTIRNEKIVVPPLAEQNEIVQYIEHSCTPIDGAISNATNQISLLQERKQIIINDVVTGKVKVS